jgi:hypothetical protein
MSVSEILVKLWIFWQNIKPRFVLYPLANLIKLFWHHFIRIFLKASACFRGVGKLMSRLSATFRPLFIAIKWQNSGS